MSSESTINKRIQKIMETEKLNFRSFGMKLGVSDVVVRNIITGRNKPSYDFIQKLIQTFVRINIEWLLTGEGEMLKGKISGVGANETSNRHIKNLEKQLQLQEKTISTLEKSVSILENQLKKCEKDKDRLYHQMEILLKTSGKAVGGDDV